MKVKKIKDSLQVEVDTAYLYETIAGLEKDEEISSFYAEMSRIERTHAKKLIEKAHQMNLEIAFPQPSKRAKILGWIGKNFGYNLILGVLVDTEKSISASVVKKKAADGKRVDGNEDRHVNILKSIGKLSGDKIGKIEGRHRSVGGNALRAAVLGANDGLVSNMSLVMGVAGATSGGSEVLIAGVAGLLAGAISMSLGEWISVKSSQELYERQMKIEMDEIENSPDEEKQELILLYKAKGIPENDAVSMAENAFKNTGNAYEILIKEELGINPDEIKSSAWEAAIASFILFVIGAIIPVAPFFFISGVHAVIISLIASTIGLFIIGASITLITGKNFFKSGIRQVIFGLLAAAVTFGIGKLIGTSISG